MSTLFTPLTLRELTFKNRIFVSPMCQYSSDEGFPNDWHLVHLGSRAIGGAALVMVEASGVSPIGRISPKDSGIWSDAHAHAFQPIVRFILEHNAIPGIQLAHAGRKGSTAPPWEGGGPVSADQQWTTLAPSAIPFDPSWPTPKAMTYEDIDIVIQEFVQATHYSYAAGFKVVELHMAHGYLLHEFLSPLSNHRTDEYGGSLENRMRFPLRVAHAVRERWPEKWPVFVRISATDWVEGGWDLAQSIIFSRELKKLGIDLIDCSSGALLPNVKIPAAPNYQVPFAQAIRKEAEITTGAVGLITQPEQAEEIIQSGKADAVFLARAMLRDPYWAYHAAQTLGVSLPLPIQYDRAVK